MSGPQDIIEECLREEYNLTVVQAACVAISMSNADVFAREGTLQFWRSDKYQPNKSHNIIGTIGGVGYFRQYTVVQNDD